MRQLTKLCWPFPEGVVNRNPSGGGTYVAHPIVEQRLLDVLGPVATEVVEVVRGHVPAVAPNPSGNSKRAKDGTLVGVVLRMTAVVDGRTVSVEEVGDCEDPNNWPHDGARMKDAMSDAYKRCAMRLGVGLHLWVKDPERNFYIAAKLAKQDAEGEVEVEPPEGVDAETGEVLSRADEMALVQSGVPPDELDATPSSAAQRRAQAAAETAAAKAEATT
jgi:hypothetical protein